MSSSVLYSGFVSRNHLEHEPGVKLELTAYNDGAKNHYDSTEKVQQHEFQYRPIAFFTTKQSHNDQKPNSPTLRNQNVVVLVLHNESDPNLELFLSAQERDLSHTGHQMPALDLRSSVSKTAQTHWKIRLPIRPFGTYTRAIEPLNPLVVKVIVTLTRACFCRHRNAICRMLSVQCQCWIFSASRQHLPQYTGKSAHLSFH